MDPNTLWHFQELFIRVGWLGERQAAVDRQLQIMEQQLAGMGRQLEEVTRQLEELKGLLSVQGERPTTRIDKIEYRFEQLKVDTLTGTLQIGMTHGVDGLIEDLSTGTQTAQDISLTGTPPPTAAGLPRITASLDTYLAAELPQDIEEAAQEAGVATNPELVRTIADDLSKQVRQRTVLYVKEMTTKEEADPETEKAIVDKVKSDVRAGLRQFFDGYGKEKSE